MARKYARLPSCDADATLDDMHARYGQTSPGSMPLEAMAKIARLLEEDDLERRRENRKLMVLITSILVVCVAVALTGASGLRETRFNSFSKRDVCKPSAAQGAPIAITIQPAAVAPGEAPAPRQCAAPMMVTEGTGCAVNSAAKYISCGGTPSDPSVCAPGISRNNGETPFAAACIGNTMCEWPCGGFVNSQLSNGGATTNFCIPPPPKTEEVKPPPAPPSSSAPPAPSQVPPSSIPPASSAPPPSSSSSAPSSPASASPPKDACSAADACKVDASNTKNAFGTCTSISNYMDGDKTIAWSGSACRFTCATSTVAGQDIHWSCASADAKTWTPDNPKGTCNTSGWVQASPTDAPKSCTSSRAA